MNIVFYYLLYFVFFGDFLPFSFSKRFSVDLCCFVFGVFWGVVGGGETDSDRVCGAVWASISECGLFAV